MSIEEGWKRELREIEACSAVPHRTLEIRARIEELERFVRLQRDSIHGLQDALKTLLLKVQGAKRIWPWWRQDMHGQWFLKSAETDKTRWDNRTFCDGDRFEEVHAVPIEADHAADSNKLPELEMAELNIRAVHE